MCAHPGLINSRPSRDDACPQRSLEDDVRCLVEDHHVTDVFVLAMGWEIKHYCGVDETAYHAMLQKYGLVVHAYHVQDLKPPTLSVSKVICMRALTATPH